jgi:ribosomal protein S8
MNYTTIKFLATIKNASLNTTKNLIVNYDNFSLSILKILYNFGLIQNYTVLNKTKVYISLRKVFNKTLTQNIKFISTPTKKLSFSYKKISLIQRKSNMVFFFSTNRGLLSGEECKRQKLGGVLLFLC